MSGDVKVLGLVGSLRRGSVNLQLLDAVRAGPPNGLVIDRFDRLKDIPPFDEDDEDAVPNAVDELRARIRAGSGRADSDAGVQRLDPGPAEERDRLGVAAVRDECLAG